MTLAIILVASLAGALTLERVAVSQGMADARTDIADAQTAAVVPAPDVPIGGPPAVTAVPVAVPAGTVVSVPVVVSAVPPEPSGLIREIFNFIRSGKGRLAAGSTLVLLVMGLRNKKLLGRFPWFATTFGGYVLGFGTTAILYLGTMLGSDAPLTLNVIGDALATAFAASGKWEALRDVAMSIKGQTPPAVRAAAAGATAIVAIVAGCYLMVISLGAIT